MSQIEITVQGTLNPDGTVQLDEKPNLSPGREGVRQYVRLLKSAFPDAVHIIDDITAEDDKVMTRVTARGTFLGECMGYQPTGRTVEISGIAVHRIANGRLIEHWAHADIAGFMHQIGADPESAHAV